MHVERDARDDAGEPLADVDLPGRPAGFSRAAAPRRHVNPPDVPITGRGGMDDLEAWLQWHIERID